MIKTKPHHHKKTVTTALLLAAGMGSRLSPLTQSAPKCLTMVNETCILDRLITSLKYHGFKRLVVVTGHLEERIRNFLEDRAGSLVIDYVFSPRYKTTNNIYSLWMARNLINEPFLLIESDLVFDPSLLKEMLYPDRIAVASIQPWLNGSTVTLNKFRRVDAFHRDTSGSPPRIKYKTVNIYSFSLPSWTLVVALLNEYIQAGRVNDYYEVIFREMVAQKNLSLKAISFDGKPWYEIDTLEDLATAERLFPSGLGKKPPFYDIDQNADAHQADLNWGLREGHAIA